MRKLSIRLLKILKYVAIGYAVMSLLSLLIFNWFDPETPEVIAHMPYPAVWYLTWKAFTWPVTLPEFFGIW